MDPPASHYNPPNQGGKRLIRFSFPGGLHRLAESVTLAVHLEYVAAMRQPVQQGRRHPLALEYLLPVAERKVAGDQQAGPLVAVGKDLEQQFGPGAAE